MLTRVLCWAGELFYPSRERGKIRMELDRIEAFITDLTTWQCSRIARLVNIKEQA